MSVIYVSAGFAIHPHLQAIEREGQSIPIRPKTFALLLLLLQKPREILSKRYLLETIWEDVIVDEAVLVQSVRELRQLFGSAEIIQTYPRKGYAWSADVQQKMMEAPTASSIGAIPAHSTPSPGGFSWRPRYVAYCAMLVIAMAVLVAFGKLALQRLKAPASADVVIVLPLKNQTSGRDHDWVVLGGMDQLIHMLRSDNSIQVMSTEYVLQLMQRAQIPRDSSAENSAEFTDKGASERIAKVFKASGADWIVEAALAGSEGEYWLDYKLHRKNMIKQGIIVDKHFQSALQKLSMTIAGYTGQALNSQEDASRNAFYNELMARALTLGDAGDVESASGLLKSLKQLEPNNILARQALARLLYDLNDYESAKIELQAALALGNKEYASRLLYALAEVYAKQKDLALALTTLDQAEAIAQSNSEILYLGEISQLRGNIQRKAGAPALALTSYQQAMKYFNVIHCSVGISMANLEMANLLQEQGQKSVAMEHLTLAKHMIEDQHISSLTPRLAEVIDAVK